MTNDQYDHRRIHQHSIVNKRCNICNSKIISDTTSSNDIGKTPLSRHSPGRYSMREKRNKNITSIPIRRSGSSEKIRATEHDGRDIANEEYANIDRKPIKTNDSSQRLSKYGMIEIIS